MKPFFYAISLLLAVVACKSGPNREQLSGEIEKLRQELANTTTYPFDSVVTHQLIEKSELYANTFKEDTLSARYMFQAAEVSKAIGDFHKAIELWNNMMVRFPNYSKAPEALFLEAFTYENDLGDKPKAKELYHEFIDKYPNHDLTDDAQQLLQIIESGKSIEEVIKGFEATSPPKDSVIK